MGPRRSATQITAVWTGDEFDEEKMTNRAFVLQRKLDWLAAELPDEPGLGGGRLLDLRHEDGRTATIAILWDPAGSTRVMTMRD